MIHREAKLIGIYTATDMGRPMSAHEGIFAIEGIGLTGDRYGDGRGAFTNAKIDKIRHVSLIEREAIIAANAEVELPYDEAETRRNLITEGIELNRLIGRTFMIGSVALRGTSPCDPCHRPDKLSGKRGFASAFENRGGLRAAVLSSGLISVHDSISE